jgi:hypothetical protein
MPGASDMYLVGVVYVLLGVAGVSRELINQDFGQFGTPAVYKCPVYAEDRFYNKGPIGPQFTKKGVQVVENPVYKKPDYWAVKLGIAKPSKRGVENHAKGGYHAALSNATGKHFHFFGACISVFPDGINWQSAVLSRGSRRDQKRFHQARVQETANCILEERCENSPRKRVHKDWPLIWPPLLKYRPLSHEALRFTRATPWWEKSAEEDLAKNTLGGAPRRQKAESK